MRDDQRRSMSDPRSLLRSTTDARERWRSPAARAGACRLKVGKELFTAAGPALVEKLRQSGFNIFSISSTTISRIRSKRLRRRGRLDVWMITCMPWRAPMMSAAREALARTGKPPKLIAVTLLTSMGAGDMADVGLGGSPQDAVLRLARLAQACGLDGVVCSPQEAGTLRRQSGKAFTLVTPGIRPAESAQDDQQRIATPRQAIADGADYLVIGRPITRAPDPWQRSQDKRRNREVKDRFEGITPHTPYTGAVQSFERPLSKCRVTTEMKEKAKGKRRQPEKTAASSSKRACWWSAMPCWTVIGMAKLTGSRPRRRCRS